MGLMFVMSRARVVVFVTLNEVNEGFAENSDRLGLMVWLLMRTMEGGTSL